MVKSGRALVEHEYRKWTGLRIISIPSQSKKKKTASKRGRCMNPDLGFMGTYFDLT